MSNSITPCFLKRHQEEGCQTWLAGLMTEMNMTVKTGNWQLTHYRMIAEKSWYQPSSATYILFPSLYEYHCSHIVNVFILAISYNVIPCLMSSSLYHILSVSNMVVLCITLHHTYAHQPVLILVVCLIYLVSNSHSVLFHTTCVHSLPE